MNLEISNKYIQKLLDSAKKSATDAIKTASKRVIQKTAEATGDLICNKIADKITSATKSKFWCTCYFRTKFGTINWVKINDESKES